MNFNKYCLNVTIYFYKYPFYFPKKFLTYDDTYELRVKIFFLLSFSLIELEKEFRIEAFLNQFDISNSRMVKLRKSIVTIVTIFHDAQDLKLIAARFTLLTKTNQTKKVSKLTSNLLGRAKSIFYTEIP